MGETTDYDNANIRNTNRIGPDPATNVPNGVVSYDKIGWIGDPHRIRLIVFPISADGRQCSCTVCAALPTDRERGVGPFGPGRGVSVLIMRATDLHVVFERTWDVSGGRKPAEARAAAEALRAAFAPEPAPAANDDDEKIDDKIDEKDDRRRDRGPRPGELARGSATRREWGTHFVAVTTAAADEFKRLDGPV